MLFTLDGCGPHEEDEWDGKALRIGEAVVRVSGPVDRCAATTRHPDTCERDLDSGNAFYNALWQQAATEGITVFVPSGDTAGVRTSCPLTGVR